MTQETTKINEELEEVKVHSETLEKKLQKLQKELDSKSETLEAMTQELNALKQEKSILDDKVAKLDSKSKTLARQIEENNEEKLILQNDLITARSISEGSKAELAALLSKINSLEESLCSANEALKKQNSNLEALTKEEISLIGDIKEKFKDLVNIEWEAPEGSTGDIVICHLKE